MFDVMITVASAEALSGNVEEARRWFERLRTETRHRSISAIFLMDDMGDDPAWGPWVDGARLAGFPVTDEEALAAAN